MPWSEFLVDSGAVFRRGCCEEGWGTFQLGCGYPARDESKGQMNQDWRGSEQWNWQDPPRPGLLRVCRVLGNPWRVRSWSLGATVGNTCIFPPSLDLAFGLFPTLLGTVPVWPVTLILNQKQTPTPLLTAKPWASNLNHLILTFALLSSLFPTLNPR